MTPEAATTNFEKYQTKNPMMRRVIERFLERITGKVAQLKPQRIVDLGCGEGLVAQRLRESPALEKLTYRGFDLNPESVAAARHLNPAMRFDVGNIITDEPDAGWADVAICLEVLEHLDEPRAALRQIMKWSREGGHVIVSVPWEPWFRLGNLMRGKHLTRLGNHPEHVQQFRPRTLKAMLLEFSPNVTIETCFPWIIGVVRK